MHYGILYMYMLNAFACINVEVKQQADYIYRLFINLNAENIFSNKVIILHIALASYVVCNLRRMNVKFGT